MTIIADANLDCSMLDFDLNYWSAGFFATIEYDLGGIAVLSRPLYVGVQI